MEDSHPSPEFYYRRGGGPVLDMGPVAITALVTLLGPVRSFQAAGRIGAARTDGHGRGAGKGRALSPEVITTINALLSFRSGAEIAFLSSWDVRNHGLRPIELYGTRASLRVPDPDFFGGEIELSTGGGWTSIDTASLPLGGPNHADPAAGGTLFANYRGVGLAEMAQAIETGRPHRCSGALALHVSVMGRSSTRPSREGGSPSPAAWYTAVGAGDMRTSARSLSQPASVGPGGRDLTSRPSGAATVLRRTASSAPAASPIGSQNATHVHPVGRRRSS